MNGADDNGPETGDDEGGAEIIAWPGRDRRVTEAAQADSGGAERPADASEALIVKTLASVTGRDPADLLRELRGEAAEGAAAESAKVVDLCAVREARRREEAASQGSLWGPVLQSGVKALFDGFARHTPPSGELVLDAGFIRRHGLQLLGEVLASVGGTLLGSAGAVQGGAAGPEAGHDETGGGAPSEAAPDAVADVSPQPSRASPEAPRRVEVEMDLGSLAAALFAGLTGRPRSEAPAAAPTPTTDGRTDPDGGPEG